MQFPKIKHKAELKFRQRSILFYKIIMIIGCCPVPIIIFINHWNSKLGTTKIVPIMGADTILLAYYISLLLVVSIWTISPFSFLRIQRLRYSLRKFIEINKFFTINPDTKEINSSMKILYYWESENLYLEVHTKGANFTNHMNDLTLHFQTLLNMKVLAVQDDFASHTTYILVKETSIPIDASEYFK